MIRQPSGPSRRAGCPVRSRTLPSCAIDGLLVRWCVWLFAGLFPCVFVVFVFVSLFVSVCVAFLCGCLFMYVAGCCVLVVALLVKQVK